MAAAISGIESDPLVVPQEDDDVQEREHQAQATRAADAKWEAAVTQQERDAADAHVRATLERTTRERAAAAPPPPSDDASSHGDPDGDIQDGGASPLDTTLHHEAATLLNLHAQAVAVLNICTLIQLLLDVNSTFYVRWCDTLSP
jgi:hypothetical protein